MGKRKKLKSIRKIIIQHMVVFNVVLFTIFFGIAIALIFRQLLITIGNEQIDTLNQVAERSATIRKLTTGLGDEIYDEFYYRFLVDPDDDLQSVYLEIDDIVNTANSYYKAIDMNLSVTILMKSGAEYFSYNETSTDSKNIKNNYWYVDNFINTKKDMWITRTNDEFNILSYGRIIRDSEDKYLGIILVSSNEKDFSDLYSYLKDNDSVGYILDENGYAISHTNQNLLGVQLMYMPVFLQSNIINDSKLIFDKKSLVYTSTYYDSDSKWTIVRETNFTTLVSNYAYLLIPFVISILVFLMLCVILSKTISSRISKPLTELSLKLAQPEVDNLQEIEIDSGCIEVSEVSKTYNEMVGKINDLIKQIKFDEQNKRIQEMKFLKLQINPHFLHNTLFSIKCLVEMNQNEKAFIMLDKFMLLLKYPIATDKELISLDIEISNTVNYFELMKIRYEYNIELLTFIEDEISEFLIPRLILQPIVENCIFHGLSEDIDATPVSIEIYAYEENGFIIIKIADNGVGMSSDELKGLWNSSIEKSKKFNNIGLNNIRERIKLIYGNESDLFVNSVKWEGIEVILKLKGQTL